MGTPSGAREDMPTSSPRNGLAVVARRKASAPMPHAEEHREARGSPQHEVGEMFTGSQNTERRMMIFP
jgi:hypothetical protein